jgi:UDP-N-acetyl-D-glucosamine dehydrogenase
VDDCRESPSFVLMEKLEAKGATLEYNDSFLPVIPATREHAHFTGKKSVEIEDIYDLILLSTNHNEYKNFDFSSYSSSFVDTRNFIKKKPKKYFQA